MANKKIKGKNFCWDPKTGKITFYDKTVKSHWGTEIIEEVEVAIRATMQCLRIDRDQIARITVSPEAAGLLFKEQAITEKNLKNAEENNGIFLKAAYKSYLDIVVDPTYKNTEVVAQPVDSYIPN